MFLKRNIKFSLGHFLLFAFFLTGVFSFCFTHEILAHDDSERQDIKVSAEVHDDHCGDGIVANFTSPGDSTLQIFHKYFVVIAYLGNQNTNLQSFFLEPPSTLARGEPPSPQPPLLQVFRC